MKLLRVTILMIIILHATGCMKDRSIPSPVEMERPEFESMIAPRDSAFAVDVDAAIMMGFSESMNPSTFNGQFYLWADESRTHMVQGEFSAEGTSILFQPEQSLLPAHEYFIDLYARAQDINGNGIDKDTILVMTSEFFTAGDYSSNALPEFAVCDGSDDILSLVSLSESQFTELNTASLDAFGRQLELTYSLDGSKLIMSDYSTSNSGIYFINPATFEVAKKLTQNPDNLGEVKKSAEIVVSNSHAFVVNQSTSILSIVDLASEEITDAVTLPDTPKGMAILPDASKIYIGSARNNEVWIYNVSTKQVEQTITIENFTQSLRLASSPDGQYVMVLELRGTQLVFIRTSDQTIAGVTTLNRETNTGNNNDLAAAGDFVYLSSNDGFLTKIQISTRTIVTELSYDNFQGIDVYPTEELLIASVRSDPAKLAVIFPETMKILRVVPISGSAPWDVAIRP